MNGESSEPADGGAGGAPRRLRRLLPTADAIDLRHPDARATLLDWYRLDSPEHVRVNLVSTLDGRAAGSDGTSASLSSPIDRAVLGVIRESADVVLVGAATLRREPGLVPRRRPLAVLSASGDLGPRSIATDDGPDLLVITTPTGAATLTRKHPGAVPLVVSPDRDGRVSLPRALDLLRDRGLRRIVAEGGPAVAAALLSADLVDELCLTLSPRLGGTGLPLLGESPPAITDRRLTQVLVDDAGALYGRWIRAD